MSEASIVMLPGLHGSVRLFEPVVPELRRRLPERELVPLPLPSDTGQDYPTLAGHFEQRLERRGPVVLVAESFSVPLALLLAAGGRIGLSGLVLVAGFCGPPKPSGFSLLPLRPLLALRVPRAAVRHFLGGDRLDAPALEAIQNEIQAAHGALLAARVRTALALVAGELPSPESVPTLALQARHDGLLPWEVQSQLERHLPHAQVAWIDGPHLLLQAAPVACAEAIAGFLGG